MPARFADLKRALLPADDEGKKRFVQAWEDVLAALKDKTKEIQSAKDTSEVKPKTSRSITIRQVTEQNDRLSLSSTLRI